MKTIMNYKSPCSTNDRESIVEKTFREWVQSQGGLCIKLNSANSVRGIPDRMILWPGGRTEFAEIKRYKGHIAPLQVMWGEKLRRMGFAWTIIAPETIRK